MTVGSAAAGPPAAGSSAAGQPVLGIDAGGSSTRWLLLAGDGEVIGSGRVGPVSGIDLRRPAGADGRIAGSHGTAQDTEPTASGSEAFANLAELAARSMALGTPARVVAGVTGLDSFSPEAERVAGFLAQRLGLSGERVSVLGDLVIAYLAAFEPGQGVLIYGGTGSVALYLAPDGTSVRAGGHGYLLDDAGGGYWIGREALRRLLRRADATGPAPGGVLARAVFSHLGGDDWPTVRAAVYDGGRASVAALTPLVARAAQRGDRDAEAVLAAAGAELARLVNVVCGRIGQVLPVALAGGVAACGEALLGPLRDALPSGALFSVAPTTPVEAAARLAARLANGEAQLPQAPTLRRPG